MESPNPELTEPIQQRLCKALRMGASYELAARYAGIPMKWFWRWKRDGKKEPALWNDPYQQKCLAFCRDVDQARADYEMGCLMRMEQLGLKHFKPLLWKWEHLSALRLPSRRKDKRHQKHKKKRNRENADE